jgi:hypothetical protein
MDAVSSTKFAAHPAPLKTGPVRARSAARPDVGVDATAPSPLLRRRRRRTTGAAARPAETHAAEDPGDQATLDRDHLLERLHELRVLVPAFAQELAGVRRVAARLRSDNRRLLAEVQRLQAKHGKTPGSPSS